MSWLDSLFARNAPLPEPKATSPQLPFAARMLSELDTLAAYVRRSSADVSGQVYSDLRNLDDILRPLLGHVQSHPVTAEREVAIESLITDYVPTSLRLFLELPKAEQEDNGVADQLIREQISALERSARKLSTAVYDDSLSALRTQSIFIQSKFNR